MKMAYQRRIGTLAQGQHRSNNPWSAGLLFNGRLVAEKLIFAHGKNDFAIKLTKTEFAITRPMVDGQKE